MLKNTISRVIWKTIKGITRQHCQNQHPQSGENVAPQRVSKDQDEEKTETPFLEKRNIQPLLNYAKRCVQSLLTMWENVLRSDERNDCRNSYIFGGKPIQLIIQGATCLLSSVVVVVFCLPWAGSGVLVKIDWIMHGSKCQDILAQTLLALSESWRWWGISHSNMIMAWSAHSNRPGKWFKKVGRPSQNPVPLKTGGMTWRDMNWTWSFYNWKKTKIEKDKIIKSYLDT